MIEDNRDYVTLPGTADDWIPKEWVIDALGHLGYLALIYRGESLSGPTRLRHSPYVINIDKKVDEENPTGPSDSTTSRPSTTSASSSRGESAAQRTSCSCTCCSRSCVSAEQAQQGSESAGRREPTATTSGGRNASSAGAGPRSPDRGPVDAGSASSSTAQNPARRPLRREQVVHFDVEGHVIDTDRPSYRPTYTSPPRVTRTLEEQVQDLLRQVASLRRPGQSSSHRPGPGFGSMPPPPPPSPAPLQPHSELPLPTRQLRRQGAFYEKPNWTVMANGSSSPSGVSLEEARAARESLVRDRGGYDDVVAEEDTPSDEAPTQQTEGLIQTGVDNSANPVSSSTDSHLHTGSVERPEVGAAENIGATEVESDHLDDSTANNDADAGMETSDPDPVNDGQIQADYDQEPIVAVHPVQLLHNATRRSPRSRNLRRLGSDPSDSADVSEMGDNDTVELRTGNKRKSGSSNSRDDGSSSPSKRRRTSGDGSL